MAAEKKKLDENFAEIEKIIPQAANLQISDLNK